MKNTKFKDSEPTPENIKSVGKRYNSANRDFQRTENETDDVSKSEKEEMEKRKERLERGGTTPNKNRIS